MTCDFKFMAEPEMPQFLFSQLFSVKKPVSVLIFGRIVTPARNGSGTWGREKIIRFHTSDPAWE